MDCPEVKDLEPPGECIALSMSNFDHVIDEGMAEALQAGHCYGQHYAWNFCGDVWWQDGQFIERVKVYRVVCGFHSAPTLRELMKVVNEAWGSA